MAKKTNSRPSSKADTKSEACPIVGIGASAGGLEAVAELLAEIPPDSGLAYVIIQHLDPKHASVLTDILARSTSMAVQEARDGIRPEPNHVYVIAPNATLTIRDSVLHAGRRQEGQHMPVDAFLRSLAADRGKGSIGIVLSGTASDGTKGLQAIKAAGGITFAQEPDTAKYDGMPRSAIGSGCVDFILPPRAIARELQRLGRHPYVSAEQPEGQDDEAAFHEIFSILRSATGVDFSAYKPGTVKRRTMRRMALHKLEDIDQYARFLKKHPEQVQSLFQDILINVTGFFREPATFDALRAHVFPALFHNRSPENGIRVWVPGCSTGEEAYTIAIVLLEYMRETSTEVPVQIFGTDLSDAALERARAGIYPESIMSEISPERLRRFFIRTNGHYQVSRAVRDSCIFARQNVTKDPPFSKLDLIVCRNVLIYLGLGLQQAVMRLFHYALLPTGYLVLGQSESVGVSSDLFAQIDKQIRMYARRPKTAKVASDVSAFEEVHQAAPVRRAPEAAPLDMQRKIEQLLLTRYSPPAIVLDRALRVLQFRGDTNRFLEHNPGEASLDLTKMSPSALWLEVRKLVRKAETRGAMVRCQPIPLVLKAGTRTVRVAVTPIAGPPDAQFLAIFEEQPAPAPPRAGKPVEAAGAARIRELEEELATTREYLQTVIEEQEAATEELKSAHEEVQSANEELQSTNEELLTAKEELQSTNEELTTFNEEMQTRNAELQQVNDDLMNLLNSINVPILMLGSDLRIRRFTPQAEKLFNLLPSDIGRPINDLRLKMNVPDLAAVCQNVADTLVSRERAVEDAEGRQYSMWIRPYRTAENRIDGLVVALLESAERDRPAEVRFRRLFEAAPDGIVIADAESGAILDVNPLISRLFGYGRNQLVGARLWDTPIFRDGPIGEISFRALAETGTLRRLAALPSSSGERIETEILCSLYDEGERKAVQMNIREAARGRRAELSGLAQDLNDALTTVLGYCDLVRQDGEPEIVAEVRAAARRAAVLVEQSVVPVRKPAAGALDLNGLLGDMRERVAKLAAGAEVEFKLEQTGALVTADRERIVEAIVNLVLNARDAIRDGGRVVIATSTGRDGAIELRVGIPSGSRSALRGPGLTATHALAGDLGAIIRVEESAYILSLPRAHAAGEDEQEFADVPGGKETVLLVEDEPSVRLLAGRVLERKGYTVISAGDGPDALRLARAHDGRIDLLIADVIMPRMSGRELAFQLAAERPDIRVLYMSGNPEAFAAAQESESRIPYLWKPFRAVTLAAKVREMLDGD